MKLIAISLNAIAILVIVWLFFSEKNASLNGKDVFIYLLFFSAPIFSLLVLTLNGGDSWLGLYFKRKALEEKQKIEKLGGK